MDNYVAPEIFNYAQKIVKEKIGSNVVIKSVEWTGGGLFNKVFYVNTNQGNFILKIECDEIFMSTRMNQIENEVYATEMLLKAGVPCAPVLAYDFSKADIGVRYVFSQRITNDILWMYWDSFSKAEKEQIRNEVVEILKKINNINSTYFGSLCPGGVIGKYNNWNECYHAILDLLISDCEKLELMTYQELSVVKAMAAKPLISTNSVYTPTFNHNDFGRHNSIWGSLNGNINTLHLIDFGNAMFGLPYSDEYMIYKLGDFDFEQRDILCEKSLDKELYTTIITDFERMLFTATQKHTNDYAHCTDQLTDGIKWAKADTSRKYIIDFITQCNKYLLQLEK